MAIVDGQIRCSDCDEFLPVERFGPAVRRNGCGQCNPCKAAARRAAYAKDRTPWQAMNLKQYGLTLETYAVLVAAQGGLCACCGKSPETWAKHRRSRRLFVDHCHVTGKIRGLLCSRCNTGIGRLGDNAEGVQRALTYLQKSGTGS